MVRLVVYNIEYCEGITGLWYDYLKVWKAFFPPRGLDLRIVEELRKLHLDILALVEVDTGSFRSKKDEVIFFENKLGLYNAVERVKYPYDGWLKLFHYVPVLRMQANAILTKYAIHDIKYHVLHEGTKRVVIEATLDALSPITILLAHLALGHGTRAKQLRELSELVNGIKTPTLLMGDFNTFDGPQELNYLLGSTHLDNLFKINHASEALTQPTVHPRRRLDYVLTSPKLKINDYRVLNFSFSDHLPLMLDFEVRAC